MPNATALQHLMRYVFENPEKALEMGQSAMEEIREKFSQESVGNSIIEKLLEIESNKQQLQLQANNRKSSLNSYSGYSNSQLNAARAKSKTKTTNSSNNNNNRNSNQGGKVQIKIVENAFG